MPYEQRHFVYNRMASALLNVTHDECHGFFCPFQITGRQGEGLGRYAQPWWNCLALFLIYFGLLILLPNSSFFFCFIKDFFF